MVSQYQVPVTIRTCLTDLTRRLEQELKANLLGVRLFGSYARGDAKPDSDIDVLIVVQNLTLELKDHILNMIADVALDYDLPLGPLVWDSERFRQHELLETLLIHNIRNEGMAT